EMLFTSFCAYSALLAAAVACLKVVSGLSLAPYVCANPRLTTPWTDPEAAVVVVCTGPAHQCSTASPRHSCTRRQRPPCDDRDALRHHCPTMVRLAQGRGAASTRFDVHPMYMGFAVFVCAVDDSRQNPRGRYSALRGLSVHSGARLRGRDVPASHGHTPMQHNYNYHSLSVWHD